jgi:hypothetical protein
MPLEFREEGHVYLLDGVVIPHVTGVLAPLESYFGVPASALEYASERGKLVHLATQMLDEGDLDEDSIDPVIAPFLAAYRQFKADAAPEWEGIEERVLNEDHHYAGTLDRRGVLRAIKGSPRVIVDLKCVAQLSPATGVQLSAYSAAVPDKKKYRRFALQLKPNATYRLKEYKEPSDWPIFLSLLSLRNWKARHGKLRETGEGQHIQQENYTS